MGSIRIIQSSPERTGSTLLLNLIHGFLSPEEEIHWDTDVKINEYLITKTHNINVDDMINRYKRYDLYFVMSERNDNKVKKLIDNRYREYSNVLIINYININVTDYLTIERVIEYSFNKFYNFFPKKIIPHMKKEYIKKNMLNRIENMNKVTEQIKDRSFEYWDKFYGVHGGHRNRS